MASPSLKTVVRTLLLLPFLFSPVRADPPPVDENFDEMDGGSSEEKDTVVPPKPTVKKDDKPAGEPVATTQVPEARERQKEALKLLSLGDTAGAQEQLRLARQADPQDQQLAALEKLLTRNVRTLDEAALKKKAEGLLEQRQDTTAGPEEAPILATPLSFGMGAGNAAARELINSPARDASRLDAGREGLVKMNLRDYPGAEQALTRKLAEDPLDWQSYRNRAFTRLKLKKYPGALQDSSRAIELNPRDAGSRRVKALTFLETDRPAEALEELDAALKVSPKDARSLVSRAEALAKLGRPEERLEDLRQAALLDPQFEALYDEALRERGRGRSPGRPLSGRGLAVYLSAAGMALFLFASALLRRRGDSAVRASPMRAADRLEGRLAGAPGGFEVIRQVGEGGMGVVYEALDLVLQRKVALKRMREEIAADPRERRRFLKEARTVAALKHPNIVEIHSVVEKDEDLYLVFEYVSGMTLSQVLGGKPYSPSGALGLARQIGQALDHAHGQGIIHQDLKPSNIMVCGGVAKVMDFGIARRLADPMSTVSRGQIVGTPAYMAPEQEQGQATKESDLYAFGLCFYEMLTGRTPFPGGGSVFQKLEKRYRPLREAAPSLPLGLDAVIDRALEPQPDKRYASAAAFLADLEGVIKPTRR